MGGAPVNSQPPLLPPPAATDLERRVARLIGILAGRDWMTAARIRALEPAWDDRDIREIASASGGVVMSWPGSPGYRLTTEGSADERERAIAKLRHQALAMGARANAIAHVHHRCPRPAQPSIAP